MAQRFLGLIGLMSMDIMPIIKREPFFFHSYMFFSYAFCLSFFGKRTQKPTFYCFRP